MTVLDGRVGPRLVREGSENTVRTGLTAELVKGDAHAKYHEAVSRGNCYMLSAATAGPTAYTGGAGGTPLLAIHNPTSSGKVFSLIAVAIALRVAASGAGQTGLNVWGGVSVAPTGTLTTPRNTYTYNQSGSVGIGAVNTALTSSTALTLVLPLFTYYWATAVGVIEGPGLFEILGLALAIPGNQLTVGLTTVPTATTCDVSMMWEEIPI